MSAARTILAVGALCTAACAPSLEPVGDGLTSYGYTFAVVSWDEGASPEVQTVKVSAGRVAAAADGSCEAAFWLRLDTAPPRTVWFSTDDLSGRVQLDGDLAAGPIPQTTRASVVSAIVDVDVDLTGANPWVFQVDSVDADGASVSGTLTVRGEDADGWANLIHLVDTRAVATGAGQVRPDSHALQDGVELCTSGPSLAAGDDDVLLPD